MIIIIIICQKPYRLLYSILLCKTSTVVLITFFLPHWKGCVEVNTNSALHTYVLLNGFNCSGVCHLNLVSHLPQSFRNSFKNTRPPWSRPHRLAAQYCLNQFHWMKSPLLETESPKLFQTRKALATHRTQSTLLRVYLVIRLALMLP